LRYLRISISYYWPQGSISFTLDELKGVPQDVISSFTKHTEDGKELYDVTYKSLDIHPVVCLQVFISDVCLIQFQLNYAQSAKTRQQAFESYEARLELNVPLFNRALKLRHSIATQMGYKSWADYKTKHTLVKSKNNIKKVSLVFSIARL
jgi:Zn-dependent oligopeptidase